MRRLKVRYRPEALADLEHIFRIVLRMSGSHVTAERFVTRVRNRCRRIGNLPRGGRPRDDLEHGLRMVPFEHTGVIAYKVETDCVRVTNVFYGRRDYEALYRGEESKDEEGEG